MFSFWKHFKNTMTNFDIWSIFRKINKPLSWFKVGFNCVGRWRFGARSRQKWWKRVSVFFWLIYWIFWLFFLLLLLCSAVSVQLEENSWSQKNNFWEIFPKTRRSSSMIEARHGGGWNATTKNEATATAATTAAAATSEKMKRKYDFMAAIKLKSAFPSWVRLWTEETRRFRCWKKRNRRLQKENDDNNETNSTLYECIGIGFLFES